VESLVAVPASVVDVRALGAAAGELTGERNARRFYALKKGNFCEIYANDVTCFERFRLTLARGQLHSNASIDI
jgi:hypothetical protein